MSDLIQKAIDESVQAAVQKAIGNVVDARFSELVQQLVKALNSAAFELSSALADAGQVAKVGVSNRPRFVARNPSPNEDKITQAARKLGVVRANTWVPPFRDTIQDNSDGYKILKFLESVDSGRAVIQEVAEATGLTPKTAGCVLALLTKRGYLRRVFQGVYARTDKQYKLISPNPSAFKRGNAEFRCKNDAATK